ncbi:gliding motility-associated C-terminal domain-containing protein [candidate division KSB1 bacterium]|nr:gliding motility-associated C-terminal domain-containing protein [candidate division KSB1 bacterium]
MNQWRIFWLLALIQVYSSQLLSAADTQTKPIVQLNFPQSTTTPLTLHAVNNLFAGDTLRLEIQIGNSDSLVTDLFGLSFRLNYDSTKWLQAISNSEGKIVNSGEFWSQNAFIFSRQDTLLNQFQVAITQLAGMPGLTGTGRVAWLRFKINPQTPDSTVLNFGLNHIVAINSQKDTLQLVSNELKVTVFQHPVFNLKCQPRSLAINWGETARYQVLLDSVYFLREKVTLSGQVNPELLAEFNPRQIGKQDTAELQILTKPKAREQKDFKIIIQGQISQFSRADTLHLNVKPAPSFQIQVVPDTFVIFPGDSIKTFVFLDSVWNCLEKIQLTCENLPLDVGTGNFIPAAIYPDDSSSFIIRTYSNAPPGEYALKIIGQGNNLIDSTYLILKVILPANFRLVITPENQSIFAGQEAKYIVKLDSVVNLAGKVHLKIQNFPAESGDVLIQPDSITICDSATITIRTKPETPPGKRSIYIAGMASGIARTAFFSLEILPWPNFKLHVNPLIQSIAAGESTSFRIEIEQLHNFQDTVTLNYSLSNGMHIDAQIAFEKSSITPGQHTNLTINTTLQTKPDDYQILILAKTDALSHEQSVNLVVTAPPLTTEWILPNPFTPNQDGFNDQVHFNLHHIETDGTILIFNFRGQKVREMRNMPYWDGTDENGAALPMGIYFYLVKIQNELKARGSLTLVR